VAPRLRVPSAEDAAFLFRLASECDLRWPTVTRFNIRMSPEVVLSTLTRDTEAGYVVLNREKEPVGVIGVVDPDVASRVVWLDGHAFPGDVAGLELVRDAVPVVLDEVARSGNVRFVYYEELVELNESLITDQVSDENVPWVAELIIPEFVCVDGVWCTRVTHRLDVESWADR
jgi:hypothetical protein